MCLPCAQPPPLDPFFAPPPNITRGDRISEHTAAFNVRRGRRREPNFTKKRIPVLGLTSPWARAPLCKGHVGRIRFFGVGAADRKVCPTANFVVRYTKKETNAEMKEGQQEARELSASNYGCNEWWLLLEPTAEPSAKRLRR